MLSGAGALAWQPYNYERSEGGPRFCRERLNDTRPRAAVWGWHAG